jgi:hypothetical protein
MIERAECKETSCSPERPPKITPTRNLVLLLRDSRLGGFGVVLIDLE